nr:hypothetical protein [Candidatus Sigynarchaeota archaeon]
MSSVEDLLEAAKNLAKAGNFEAAIQQLRQCVALMERTNDLVGITNIHLMILDMEKLKAKAVQAKASKEPPRPKEPTRPAMPVKTPSRPESAPSLTQPKVASSPREEALRTWEEAKQFLATGDKFAAMQKFIVAKRAISKLGDPALLSQIDNDIAGAKGTGAFESTGSPAVPAEAVPEKTPQQLFSQAQQPEMFPVFQKAMADKEKGSYAEALDGFKKCYEMALGPERREIEKQIRKLEQLVSLKEKITSTSPASGFVTIGQDTVDQPVAAPLASQGAQAASFARLATSTAPDLEERAKAEKRKEAEQLIVEAENSDNPNDAIEKLKDASHLFLVTGSRLDRVEWIYDKIAQIRNQAGQQKVTLFEVEKFPSPLLRDFAFQRIDIAKDKIRYGKYKDAVELYKQCVKALTKAGWSQDQINYIINDMILVRKDQDRVELEEEQLLGVIEEEMFHLLDRIDQWRAGKYIGYAPTTATFDEDIHRPGREKTVEEKHVEKVIAIQAERQRWRQAMDDSMDEAKHMTELGRFQEAINLYQSALNLMDQLGGWENQKIIITSEMENLKQLHRKQQEILNDQKLMASSGTAKQKADFEEKFFLIKQAAVLNQENLKDKLMQKRAKDEMEKAVFEILIPAANDLKEQGKLDDALVEFKEALKILTDAGWTSQTQSLRDEIADLEGSMQKKADTKGTASDRRAIRNDVFEHIIPAARQAVLDGHHAEGKKLYETAVQKLRSIGWDEYVNPILENIAEIDATLQKIKAKEESITEDDRKKQAKEHIDMGMRFMAKDMKKYALAEFSKAIALSEQLGDTGTVDELKRQAKKLELEIKLEESQKILTERKKST